MSDHAQAICQLNDRFRTSFEGGRIVCTAGLAERDDLTSILAKVRAFDEFSTDNDPYAEHDFGAFDHGTDKIFWKIDYYDPTLTLGSDNPADPELTTRVLTVMLAQEY